MTLNKRLFTEFADALAIRFTCRECQCATSISLMERPSVLAQCPNCQELWFPVGSADYNGLQAFVRTIMMLRTRGEEANCQIQLEFEYPDPSP